jgi:hypothetical protein
VNGEGRFFLFDLSLHPLLSFSLFFRPSTAKQVLQRQNETEQREPSRGKRVPRLSAEASHRRKHGDAPRCSFRRRCCCCCCWSCRPGRFLREDESR